MPDPLTGLLTHLERTQWQRLASAGGLLIDIDGFNWVNDALGFDEGHRILATVAGAIAATVAGAGGTLVRVGGDEFLALLPDHDLPTLERVARQLIEAVHALAIPYRREDQPKRDRLEVNVVALREVAGLIDGLSNHGVTRAQRLAIGRLIEAGKCAAQVAAGVLVRTDDLRPFPPSRLGPGVSGALRKFSYWVASGTLGHPVLEGTGYREAMLEEPSLMEMAFAIFANVLTLDERGHPTNTKEAEARAAQYVRSYCDPTYVVEPPFEQWEMNLY
jgi:diguanylate cyclase (GGDEF)-like protein